MSILLRFQTIEDKDKHEAVRRLVEGSTGDFNFSFMMVLAVMMATLGLLAGNEAIVIGSMLVAPLLYPVLSLGLGISMSDYSLISRSSWTVVKASLLSVFAAAATTVFFTFSGVSFGLNDAIALRIESSLLYLVVAVVSGLAMAYALVKPRLSETLPGVAISVALIPPLAAIGVGVAWLSLPIIAGAAMMFFVNVFGILAAATLSFSLMDVHGEQKTAAVVIAKEERRVEREDKKASTLPETEAKQVA
ncbi:hypothetical protein COU20_03055 [Candidatus Kaiserbacteria bacterium CG10_big_fil_rev_8_21_14_0_10_59_10]|uniref:TIGR00341 family protein n=1 Tax=Candidatus Kaiserbacteria bacterium CG10_big_fil_rev_8_21_14_0_10_59_10 TaxID=1974612 RepID=A0A2H0U7C4_9BACT|nr:MAG: hypothetical protein COU20_03055 [Candidatus Kaiserbacteria bacterium CG10_big_fil_rev_8_21_14_0_10_59_10]